MIKSGFTLVELLIVISILAILGIIGVISYSNINARARGAKINTDFETIETSINQIRLNKNKPLTFITNDTCSLCGFCDVSGQPVNSANCITRMQQQYELINEAALPFDPWGGPYLIDENETDFQYSCPPGKCCRDKVYSAGPDGLFGWANPVNLGGGDDFVYQIPAVSCVPPYGNG